MERQVGIFIETNPAQADSEFVRLELFNDEKISVNSTIQDVSDISKIKTDFSQGFTIPCSPVNNAIFQHFYQNDVDASISYQNRYNAYIEIDTILFRRGKIQFEKANLKNGKPESYSITFYGAGVSLKDHFLEDKLSQLDYSSIDHPYSNTEVYNRVTTDSTVTDYDVRYPMITSKRVWQYDANVPIPQANTPDWYTYPTSNQNNLHHVNGRVFFTELFPAVRVATIMQLIASKYGIVFNGVFLLSDVFRKAFLYFKNKEVPNFMSNASDLDITTTSNPLVFFTATNKFGLFYTVPSNVFLDCTLNLNVTSLTPDPTNYYIDVYNNNVFYMTLSGTTTGGATQFAIPVLQSDILTFKVRSANSAVINFNFLATVRTVVLGSISTSTATASGTVTTNTNTNLSNVAPDMKIEDFIKGICKEFNLTVYSNKKNEYTFDTIPFWYSTGAVYDITKYTDVSSIEVERVKLYKSIEFKYQDSESFMNKAFVESVNNPDAHQYGNLNIGFNYDGSDYKIESPFENLLHNNFGNQLQVGYCLNKEFTAYVPKPVLLYMNKKTTITGGGHFHWDGQADVTGYVPFGQDSEVLFGTGLVPLTLNFGAEISSFYNAINTNSLYQLYYSNYITNLYNAKNRLTKVKTILPVGLLTKLELNDRLIIRDKRYFINEMQTDLTTGEVNFTLLNDFQLVTPAQFANVPVSNDTTLQFVVGLTNGGVQVDVTKSANASNVVLSLARFTEDGLMTVTVPANAARTIVLTLETSFPDRERADNVINYIIIEQA